MPSDKPKYFKKIKLQKNVLTFNENKKIKDNSNKFHVICD
jgi:hypothetical protein